MANHLEKLLQKNSYVVGQYPSSFEKFNGDRFLKSLIDNDTTWNNLNALWKLNNTDKAMGCLKLKKDFASQKLKGLAGLVDTSTQDIKSFLTTNYAATGVSKGKKTRTIDDYQPKITADNFTACDSNGSCGGGCSDCLDHAKAFKDAISKIIKPTNDGKNDALSAKNLCSVLNSWALHLRSRGSDASSSDDRRYDACSDQHNHLADVMTEAAYRIQKHLNANSCPHDDKTFAIDDVTTWPTEAI